MKAYLSGWESLCTSSTALRFVDSNLRGIGQVMFQDNPAERGVVLRRHRLGGRYGGHAAGGDLRRDRRRRGDADCTGAARRRVHAALRPLRLQRRPGGAGTRDLHRTRSAALAVRRARRRGLGRDDVRDGQRPQGLRAADPDVSVRDRHVAAAARQLRVRGSRRRCAARGGGGRAVRVGGLRAARGGGFPAGYAVQHFAGFPQGERRCGTCSSSPVSPSIPSPRRWRPSAARFSPSSPRTCLVPKAT